MSRYGICHIAQAPLRDTISHSSEMISQVLFGDIVEIKDKYQNWNKVETLFDGYEGWLDEKQFIAIEQEDYEAYKADKNPVFSTGFLSEAERDADHSIFRIGMGCRLPLFKDGSFKLGKLDYSYKNPVWEIPADAEQKKKAVLERASLLINTPYLWGGKSSVGTDCSGFTQLILRSCGINLLRNASQQAGQGTLINLLAEAQAGDLLFFDNENEQIVHTGIYTGNGHVIHASGYVRIDPVDHEGIYRQDMGSYTHHLRLIRRMF
ncbi:MAG: C40 family peptidase [Lentimicrobiaceae bacterium]|nr:C40 family peptidase [Lentimicrobiaceae bacterium]